MNWKTFLQGLLTGALASMLTLVVLAKCELRRIDKTVKDLLTYIARKQK